MLLGHWPARVVGIETDYNQAILELGLWLSLVKPLKKYLSLYHEDLVSI